MNSCSFDQTHNIQHPSRLRNLCPTSEFMITSVLQKLSEDYNKKINFQVTQHIPRILEKYFQKIFEFFGKFS